MNSSVPADNSRCPGCGAANQCAIAAGNPPGGCWCMAEPRGLPVPTEIPGAVASCWCPVCLRQQAPPSRAD